MALLKLYIKRFFFLFFLLNTSATAGVLPMFSPEYINEKKNYFLKTDILLANDPFSLESIFNHLKKDFHPKNGKNIAYANERIDTGCITNYGYFGYVYREEIFIKSNRDFIEFFYLTHNKKNLPINKTYTGKFNIKAYKMNGIIYSKKFQKSINSYFFSGGIGLEALYATDMQNGYIKGKAYTISQKNYNFEAFSNYNYTHNYLYKLNVNKSSAYGYTSHIFFNFKHNKINLKFLANDLFSNLYWKNLPYSKVYLNSNNKVYDKNGYAIYNPTVHGKEGYKNYNQRLIKKIRIEEDYKNYNNTFILGSDYIQNIYIPYIIIKHYFSKIFSFSLGYETRFSSVSLAIEYKNVYLHIRSDKLKKPSTLSIMFSIFL
jgi:hypothetical protein